MDAKTTARDVELAEGQSQLAAWFARAEADAGGAAGVIVAPAASPGGVVRIDIGDAEIVGGVFVVRRRELKPWER